MFYSARWYVGFGSERGVRVYPNGVPANYNYKAAENNWLPPEGSNYLSILGHIPIAIFRLDLDGSIVWFNSAAAALLSFLPNKGYGQPVVSIFREYGFKDRTPGPVLLQAQHEQFDKWRELVTWAATRGAVWHGARECLDCQFRLYLLDNCDTQGYYLFAEEVREQDFTQHEKGFDLLTGLPNRLMAESYFWQQKRYINAHYAPGQLLYYILIDLDEFKQINNRYGHRAGDQVLLAVSQRLRQAGQHQGYLARLESDEFLIILPQAAEQELLSLLDELISQMTEPFWSGSHQLKVSASISVTAHGKEDESSLVLGLSTRTLARQESEGMRYLTPKAAHDIYRLSTLTKDIDRAIRNNEFFLQYQVQVDAKDYEVLGAEALIRWQHPDFGLVAPGVFVPLVEDSRKSAAMGYWVLREVCRQSQLIREQMGKRLRISVNITVEQVLEVDFYENLCDILEMYGVAPAEIELEITETMLISEVESVRQTLQRLSAKGISIALDDFGTGYSSLSHLVQFPVSRLKIDGSFVSQLPNDMHHAAIVRAIIGMGRSLGLRVVAEGVETEEQRDWLVAEGCHELQGFLFARPQDPDALMSMIMHYPGGLF
ncbi:putative bifunctional diguanylate cyclase/phosphodiesterase [Kerstersia similis]|uniref:putative bifunctional diguanylate cyclase/phosphodiesterase n=1 Tax=Kerstersia similis TaxID=206505 RepID=UPI0039EE28F8